MMQTDDHGAGAPTGLHRASELLREMMLASRELERKLGHHLGVNPTDLEVLQLLILLGPLSPTVLAKSLGISTAAATVATDRLVRIGHVSREPHPTDRRRLLVVPREQSVRQAMDYLRPIITSTDALLNKYTPAEQAAIADYLERAISVTRNPSPATDQDQGATAGKGLAP
jgi:DNA-binding MarR family transcriptional regulator